MNKRKKTLKDVLITILGTMFVLQSFYLFFLTMHIGLYQEDISYETRCMESIYQTDIQEANGTTENAVSRWEAEKNDLQSNKVPYANLIMNAQKSPKSLFALILVFIIPIIYLFIIRIIRIK